MKEISDKNVVLDNYEKIQENLLKIDHIVTETRVILSEMIVEQITFKAQQIIDFEKHEIIMPIKSLIWDDELQKYIPIRMTAEELSKL